MKYAIFMLIITVTMSACLTNGDIEISDPELLGKLVLPIQIARYNIPFVHLVCSKESETIFHQFKIFGSERKYWHLHEMKIGEDIWVVRAKSGSMYLYFFANHKPEESEYLETVNKWAYSQ